MQASTSPLVSQSLSIPSSGVGVTAASGNSGGRLESNSSQPQLNGELSQTGATGLAVLPSLAGSRATLKAATPLAGGLQGQLIDELMGGWGIAGASLAGWT